MLKFNNDLHYILNYYNLRLCEIDDEYYLFRTELTFFNSYGHGSVRMLISKGVGDLIILITKYNLFK